MSSKKPREKPIVFWGCPVCGCTNALQKITSMGYRDMRFGVAVHCEQMGALHFQVGELDLDKELSRSLRTELQFVCASCRHEFTQPVIWHRRRSIGGSSAFVVRRRRS